MPHDRRDSIQHTFFVAAVLCLVCSLAVSVCAVLLRPWQEYNREQYRKKNILIAAGLFDEETDASQIPELFERVETKLVDLETGEYVEEDAAGYDPVQAARSGEPLSPEDDPARIKRRERHAQVYLVRKDGRLDQVVLPIRGYGLWSTLYGFLSLDAQSLKRGPEHLVVRGLTYYKHAETPGLGAEVDNPVWKAKWPGKKPFDDDWNVLLEVTKAAEGEHEVDALSGATITSRGVTNMMKFWFGPDGFQPYLKHLQQELSGQTLVGDADG